jgi:hypothetical protein
MELRTAGFHFGLRWLEWICKSNPGVMAPGYLQFNAPINIEIITESHVSYHTFDRILFMRTHTKHRRSQWSQGLRRRSAAVCLLKLWVQIPPRARMFVCYECCLLSGGDLYDELITHLEEFYRLWCVNVCDLQTSWVKMPWHTGGCRSKNKQTDTNIYTRRSVLTINFSTLYPYLQNVVCPWEIWFPVMIFCQHIWQLVKKKVYV